VGVALRARSVELSYEAAGRRSRPVLDLPMLDVASGEAVGLTGPSGAGKTSLLHVLAGLTRPQRGSIEWGGVDIVDLAESRRSVAAGNRRLRVSGFPPAPRAVACRQRAAPGHVLSPGGAVNPASPGARAPGARRVRVADAADVDALARRDAARGRRARAALRAAGRRGRRADRQPRRRERGAVITRLLLECCGEARSTLLVVSHDRRLLEGLDRSLLLVSGRLAPSLAAVAVG
jgi:putative ABC transport system ATP-binding protein